MQASNLILFNQKEAVRCCCFVCGSYVALASENLLYVFNLAEGKSVPKCRQEVDKEYSPIGLHLVSAH